MERPAVLVTGGAQRIGAAFCRAFADAGWYVVIHYRSSSDEAEALANELPSAETVQTDLDERIIDGSLEKLPRTRPPH